MSNRVALVTGGAAGIGEGISRRLAKDGMAVAILDIDMDAATALANAITAEGNSAIAVVANVADRIAVREALTEARNKLGPITVLVNNAGIEGFTPFEEITDEEWDRLLSINLKGTFIVTQEVLPDMKAANWGRIVNISSSSAQSGAVRMAHYAASKGGMIALTKVLARELGGYGITCNTIPPGFIMTPMTERAYKAGKYPVTLEQATNMSPLKKAGKPDDIAAACAYLVAEDAGYITGQIIGVNGGRYI